MILPSTQNLDTLLAKSTTMPQPNYLREYKFETLYRIAISTDKGYLCITTKDNMHILYFETAEHEQHTLIEAQDPQKIDNMLLALCEMGLISPMPNF